MQALTLLEPDGNLHKQCSHLLYKLCKGCRLLPTTYILQQELVYDGNNPCCGGFAEVSEGEYLGRHAAIKSLRFRPKDAFDEIFKVLEFYALGSPQLFTLCVAVLL